MKQETDGATEMVEEKEKMATEVAGKNKEATMAIQEARDLATGEE